MATTEDSMMAFMPVVEMVDPTTEVQDIVEETTLLIAEEVPELLMRV